ETVRGDKLADAALEDAMSEPEPEEIDASSSVVEDDEPPADPAVPDAEPPAEPPAAPTRVSLPSRAPPPMAFEREEDASALLLRQQQRDAWVARAEWLKAEAEALEDTGARARALLTVSELYAMSGEEATARAVADEALKLGQNAPLVSRQVRGLMARDAGW